VTALVAAAPSLARALLADRAAAASSRTGQDRRAALESVVRSFVRAWNGHDIDTLAQLFTADANFTSPSGEGATTRKGIRKLLAHEHREIFRESTLDARTRSVTLRSPTRARAAGRYKLSNIPVAFGIDVARDGTFHFAFERHDGRWLIASARIGRQ
jgi:uncharacterized protein (TIGR02246 family)